jgi:methionine-rich copper-binding protein CopC
VRPAVRTLPLLRLLAAAALTLLVVHPVLAAAHAGLVGSDPEQGERLAEAPSVVTFEFTEAMSEPAYVAVTPPDGSDVLVGEPVVDGATVRQRVRPGGPAGEWTTAVRAVSSDGHPVTVEIAFTVADSADSPESARSTEPARSTELAEPVSPSSEDDGWSATEVVVAAAIGTGAVAVAVAAVLVVRRRRATR